MLAIADSTGVPMIGGVDALLVVIAIVSRSQAYLSAAAAVVGSVVGSLILFMIARKGGEEYHRRHTSSTKGSRFRAWFHEYGLLTVFIPAAVPIPLPLKIFIISAGALGENPLTFSLVMLAARIPRYWFLVWLGSNLGSNTIPYLKHHVWELIVFSCALFVVLYGLIRIVHSRRIRDLKATARE